MRTCVYPYIIIDIIKRHINKGTKFNRAQLHIHNLIKRQSKSEQRRKKSKERQPTVFPSIAFTGLKKSLFIYYSLCMQFESTNHLLHQMSIGGILPLSRKGNLYLLLLCGPSNASFSTFQHALTNSHLPPTDRHCYYVLRITNGVIAMSSLRKYVVNEAENRISTFFNRRSMPVGQLCNTMSLQKKFTSIHSLQL